MTSQAAELPTGFALDDTAKARVSAPSGRIAAIDLLRGVIMVLMVIDHVRVFSAVPPGGPDPAIFFTRWITHFCAPGFVFFAGTAAFLHGRKLHSRGATARWLAVRGVWLILLELTWMRLSWTFNLDFQHYLLAGVLWVIGWCMIALAGLIFLPTRGVGALGVAILLLHNLMDPHVRPAIQSLQGSPSAWVWQVLYLGGSVGPLTILYTLIPWAGVMAAGWAFGAVLLEPPDRRRRICLSIGLGAIAGFVLLRATAL